MTSVSTQHYYQATRHEIRFDAPLSSNSECEVLIIGGGFAGLNTALGLVERGQTNVIVLESERIGFGASGRNGGFVFGGYSLGEAGLLAQLGAEKAKRVYQRTVDAVNLIRQRIGQYQINCDLVDEGVIWANWFRDPEIVQARQRLLAESYGVQWEFLSQTQMRQQVNTARYFNGAWERNALHLHPLNYATGLAQACARAGARVHEGARAFALAREGAGWRVRVGGPAGEQLIRARQVVLACGGYLAGLNDSIDRSILPIATYVMVTEPLGSRINELFPQSRAAIYDTRFAFDYYRPLQDSRLLWGGRISILDRSPQAVSRLLKRDVLKVFPSLQEVRIDYAWSGLMSYARHEMPQIRSLGNGLWCAQGFGGHGLSSTCAAGEVLASALVGDDAAIRDYQAYGLVSAFKPMGYLGAQATYSWLQFKDWWRDRSGR